MAGAIVVLYFFDVRLALVVMATTLAAALYPAVLAARIRPLEALNFI